LWVLGFIPNRVHITWSPLSLSGCTEGLAWAEQPGVGSTIGSGVTCMKGGVDCTKKGGVGYTKGGAMGCTNGEGVCCKKGGTVECTKGGGVDCIKGVVVEWSGAVQL